MYWKRTEELQLGGGGWVGDLGMIHRMLCCVVPLELSLMCIVLPARWTCSKRLSC